MSRMRAKEKKEWTAALRSGEYEQGQGVLHNEEGKMCCIGVLIDVTQDGEWIWNEPLRCYEFEECGFSLPSSLRDRLGIHDDVLSSLIHMNDGRWENDPDTRTFPEIADWIEENL